MIPHREPDKSNHSRIFIYTVNRFQESFPMLKIGVAAFAAGMLAMATSAMANDNPAASGEDHREVVTLRVNAQDVNFANPEAVAQFRRDMERQIAEACNPGDRVGADMKPDFKCRREMAANLEPTVTHLAMRATQGDRRFVGVE